MDRNDVEKIGNLLASLLMDESEFLKEIQTFERRNGRNSMRPANKRVLAEFSNLARPIDSATAKKIKDYGRYYHSCIDFLSQIRRFNSNPTFKLFLSPDVNEMGQFKGIINVTTPNYKREIYLPPQILPYLEGLAAQRDRG